MLLVLALMCLGAAVYFVGDLVTQPGREREHSVKRAARYGKLGVRARPQQARFRQRVMLPLRDRVAALVLKTNPRQEPRGGVDQDPVGRPRPPPDGDRGPRAGRLRRGRRTSARAELRGASSKGATGLFFILAFSACGFFAPDGLLTMMIRRRKDEIGASLPDALDLLAVSVEAGLVVRRRDREADRLQDHGPLVDEFSPTPSEMRICETRAEALKRLAVRVPTPEVNAFVRSIVQSDQLGTSLGLILKVQAAWTRVCAGRRAAEEKAMKAPIKMLFPTVLFIFPSMFGVILGPA